MSLRLFCRRLSGDIAVPYQWDPEIVPIQILRVGNVFILAVPAEFTTMAGRRIRNAIKKILVDGNIVGKGQEVHVTIAGLSNTYSSYVVTYEEYQAQRYEAASCIFGPHALDAYIQEFSRLARDLVSGQPSVQGKQYGATLYSHMLGLDHILLDYIYSLRVCSAQVFLLLISRTSRSR